MIQEWRRLFEIFQPPDAFLSLDGNPGRIDLLFKRCRPLEFLPGPEFNGRQPQRHTLDCNCKARMHQDAANRVRSEATRLAPSTVYALGDADRFGIFALIAKLGCIVQHKNETFSGCGAITVNWKWRGQNVRFADPSLERKR